MLVVVAFALAALAAYGLDAVLTAGQPSELRAVSRHLGLIAAIGMVLLLAATLIANFARRPMAALAIAYLEARFEEAPAHSSLRLDLLFHLFTPVHLGALVPLLMASAGLALVRLFATCRIPVSLFLSLIVGLTAADLLYFGLKYNTFAKAELDYSPTEATTFLGYLLYRDPAGRPLFPHRTLGPMPPDTNMPYRLQVAGGYDSIRLASYQEYLQLFHPRPSLNAVILTRYDSTLLDLVNMKHEVCADRPGDPFSQIRTGL